MTKAKDHTKDQSCRPDTFAKALIIDNMDTEIEDAPEDSYTSEDEPAAED